MVFGVLHIRASDGLGAGNGAKAGLQPAVNVALNQMRAVMRRVADRKHEVHYYEPVIIVEVEGPLDEDDDIVLDFGGDPFWN